jgi:hypothetical protein
MRLKLSLLLVVFIGAFASLVYAQPFVIKQNTTPCVDILLGIGSPPFDSNRMYLLIENNRNEQIELSSVEISWRRLESPNNNMYLGLMGLGNDVHWTGTQADNVHQPTTPPTTRVSTGELTQGYRFVSAQGNSTWEAIFFQGPSNLNELLTLYDIAATFTFKSASITGCSVTFGNLAPTNTPNGTTTATPGTPTETPTPDGTTTPTLESTLTATPDGTTTATETPGTPTETETPTAETPTDTPTLEPPTETPTPETPTETLTPSITPTEPTFTPTASQTFTPTRTPDPGLEMIANGGFETNADGDKLPDGWKAKRLSKDRLKCNKGEKVFAFEGQCAFQFKGGSGEKSSLQQRIPLESFVITPGDVLTFSAQMNASGSDLNGSITLTVDFTDAVLDNLKITFDFAPTTAYTLQSQTRVLFTDNIGKITVKMVNRSGRGKVFIDAISLLKQANPNGIRTDTLMPLP